jgi:hypothetical protein
MYEKSLKCGKDQMIYYIYSKVPLEIFVSSITRITAIAGTKVQFRLMHANDALTA